ncbi:MAG: prepilin peptidase [Methylocystaceae bacterium]
MIEFLIIVVALVIGSFLNVVIWRLPQELSLIFPPSHCPHCQHRLGARDLIPIFSYLLLRGYCRFCRGKISVRYPLIEALTAAAFLLVYRQYGFSMVTLAGWLLGSILIICAFIDIDHGIIPDRVTYPALGLGLVLSWWTVSWQSALFGAALFSGILILAAVLSRGGMGGGDIKLAAVVGIFAGLPGAVVGLFIASITGGLWASILLLIKRAGRKSVIRFGPFLALGGWLGMVYGTRFINWYFGLLAR